MGEEFQAEVSWWNISSRNNTMFGSSPCSSGVNLDLGSFGWPADFLDIKTRCSAKHSLESDESNSASDGSIVIQDHFHRKPNKHQDSSLQFMGSVGLSSSTTTADHWDPSLINGSPDDQTNSYPPILQNSNMNYGQESCPPPPDIQNTFSAIDSSSSSINNSFKPSLPNDQQTGFPINSVSYGYPSSLLQTLFDDAPEQQPAFFAANQAMNYQNPGVNMQFPASQSFCSAGDGDFRAGFFPSSQPQFLSSTFNEKANLPNFTSKANMNDEVQGKKSGSEPAFKRPRIETPSPLPTFKVRKEKLGDRITALQQLVSPFGKTDTASVLHEAIEYIKFLHDQVNMLSTPYKKSGSPINRQQKQQQISDNKEVSNEDLRSKGLCLVPISSTFPVAAETTTDFWTPTFGGTFR